MQKIRRYVNVFAKNDSLDNKEESERSAKGCEPADMKSMQNDSSNENRKSVLCWNIIRQSFLGLDLESEEHLNSIEMKPV